MSRPEPLTVDALRALLDAHFAPWVQALGLAPVEVTATGAVFSLPCGPEVARGGGGGPAMLCGQAMAASADTASVLTISALNGRFRNCTTVDLTTHFLRPVMTDAAEVRVEALSNGRRMATTRVEVRPLEGGTPGKLAATGTCAFAYLED
ncbi:MAG: PaaI family thioesterase [Pseudomonadota bacterium]